VHAHVPIRVQSWWRLNAVARIAPIAVLALVPIVTHQEIVDLAMLNAVRAAVPGGELSDD